MFSMGTAQHALSARVQGAAFGGALGLICACDITIAASDSRFSLSEVKLGLIPALISPYVQRAIGERQARRFMLSAEQLSASQAVQIGLVHQQTPIAELNSALETIIASLLQGAPQAQQSCKRLLAEIRGQSPQQVKADLETLLS